MVLPGWQQELAELRKEQASAAPADLPTRHVDIPAARTVQPDLPTIKMDAPSASPDLSVAKKDAPAPSVSPTSQVTAPPLPSARPAVIPPPAPKPLTPLPALPETPRLTSAEQQPSSAPKRPGEASAEQTRRELHVRVWEEEATMQFPQVALEGPEIAPGPAPALEQLPVTQLNFDEDQPSPVADLETLHWQTVPRPESQARPSPEPVPAQKSVHPTIQTALPAPAVAEPITLIEDLPTMPIEVPPVQLRPGIVVERSSTPAPSRSFAASDEAIEDLPTMPIAVSQATRPAAQSMPPTTPPAFAGPAIQQQSMPPTTPPAFAGPANPFPNSHYGDAPISQPGGQPVGGSGPVGRPVAPPESWGLGPRQNSPYTPPPSGPHTPLPPTETGQNERKAPEVVPLAAEQKAEPVVVQKKRRKAPVGRILAAVLVIALIAGGALYYLIDQPFTNQLTTQISQSYQSTSLGFALSYPYGWKSSAKAGSVFFTDSSQTGQVELSAVSTGAAQTLSEYLSSEEQQLGITGAKNEPSVGFAGATWTAVQGSAVEQGATYTVTLYVTQHNGRLYALACLAPAPVYTQMEHDSFAPLRQTFSFL
jgi:hypothetical protein